MNFGIPTLIETDNAETLAAFCAENGFDFVEMNLTFPWFQADAINEGLLRELRNRYGVGFTIHMHDQFNPFEFSPELRSGNLEHARFALGLARELELPRVTMHLLPGTYASVNGNKIYLYQQCEEDYLRYVEEFREFVHTFLKGTNTLVCIENTKGFQPFQQKAIRMMLESKQFGLTFDIGHSFKAVQADETFMLENANRIKHFHIHDCSMTSNHLAFGEGGLDLERWLKTARDLDASVVAEVKESSALISSKQYLIEKGFWHDMSHT